MTEKNMKKLYEFYRDGRTVDGVITPPQPERAQKILNIPRYAHFKEKTSKEKEPEKKTKSIKEK